MQQKLKQMVRSAPLPFLAFFILAWLFAWNIDWLLL